MKKLKAEFCAGQGEGRGDVHETKLADMDEIKRWADEISAAKGYRSVFKEEFYFKNDTSEQWGTGYFWLCVTKE